MVNIACSSLIQTILSVLEFHQISRLSGSRTITAGRESQLMLITTTPKNFLLSASDYTTYRYLLSIQLFHYASLLTLLFQAIIINSENERSFQYENMDKEVPENVNTDTCHLPRYRLHGILKCAGSYQKVRYNRTIIPA